MNDLNLRLLQTKRDLEEGIAYYSTFDDNIIVIVQIEKMVQVNEVILLLI